MSLVNTLLCQLCDVTFDNGTKYLVFFSSHSLKTREKYSSFAQLVLPVCIFFEGSVFTFQFLNDESDKWIVLNNCEFYHSKIEK